MAGRGDQTSRAGSGPPAVHRVLQSGASVHAGEQVTRGKHGVRSESRTGTAGLIVRKKGTTSGRFVLTCAHVFGMPAIGEGQGRIDADAVYAPHLSVCLSCEYDHPIGSVVDATLPTIPGPEPPPAKITIGGVDYAVDASLVQLKPATSATNKVPEIGEITAVRDLIAEFSPSGPGPLSVGQQLAVRKYGAVTELTQGKLASIVDTDVEGGGKGLLLEVDAVLGGGESPPTATYQLDMARQKEVMFDNTPADVAARFAGTKITATIGGTADQPTITVTGKAFSASGDSGSPVVDGAGKVIGILRGGTVVPIFVVGEAESIKVHAGQSQIVFIRAAMEKLDVELMPPGQKTAGGRVAAPGMLLERGNRRAVDWNLLAVARARLERTPLGARLSALGQQHFPEVRELVHHHRRVMVTWHRHQGPGFVNAFITAMDRPGWPVPREVGGVRLGDTLRAMRDALSLYGSSSLRTAITRYQDEILSIVDRTATVEDLLGEWGPPPLRLVTARGVPGSAAAIVVDAIGTRHLLTAYHIAFGRDGAAGDRVYAVPGEEADPSAAVPLGQVARGQIGRFGTGASFVDAALVELADQDLPDWLVNALATLPTRPTDGVEPGAPVTKDGPATGTTRGVILDPVYHDHPVIDGRGYSAPGQLLIGPASDDLLFCAPGDSGAAVLDEQGRLAGLLWGSTAGGSGLAVPVATVLAALNVHLTGISTVEGALR